MTNQEILKTSEALARKAHDGQFRRDGKTPYIEHPKAVAETVSDDITKSIAWLHDVLEDTKLTMFDLGLQGIPPEVAIPVEVLTKKEGVSYRNYLANVKQNYRARQVKIADMLCNLTDSPTEKQVKKYKEGILFLT